MSDEKKGNITELKVSPRFATPDMLDLADDLERMVSLLREGKVPAAAVAWVEEKVNGDIQCVRQFAYEARLTSLTGNVCALLAKLNEEMNHDV